MNKLFRPDVTRDIQFIDEHTCLVPVIDELSQTTEIIMSIDDAEQFVAEQIMLLTDDCGGKTQ